MGNVGWDVSARLACPDQVMVALHEYRAEVKDLAALVEEQLAGLGVVPGAIVRDRAGKEYRLSFLDAHNGQVTAFGNVRKQNGQFSEHCRRISLVDNLILPSVRHAVAEPQVKKRETVNRESSAAAWLRLVIDNSDLLGFGVREREIGGWYGGRKSIVEDRKAFLFVCIPEEHLDHLCAFGSQDAEDEDNGDLEPASWEG